MQRLGLEPRTFRLQTVGSTAAPGPPFDSIISEPEKRLYFLGFNQILQQGDAIVALLTFALTFYFRTAKTLRNKQRIDRSPGVSREQEAINRTNKLESSKRSSDGTEGYRRAIKHLLKRESLIFHLQILSFLRIML